MAIYYSPSIKGFFDDRNHGTLKTQVPDPKWKRPTIKVPDETVPAPMVTIDNPDWVRPTKVVEIQGLQVLALDTDAVPDKVEVIDPTWNRPLVSVPDASAMPNLIGIDNPDCKLPSDVIEVTDAEHEAFLDALSTGAAIALGQDGKLEIVS